MAESLDDAEVGIETEVRSGRFAPMPKKYIIDDLKVELPKVGQQLNYLQITATRARSGEAPRELLKIYLSRKRSTVEATEPDPHPRGIISDIQSLAKEKSRIPAWLYIRDKGPFKWGRVGGLLVIVLVFIAFSSGLSIADSVTRGHKVTNDINNLVTGIIAVLMAAFITTTIISVRTILLTGTRSEAPTFWQRHGADITINLVIGVVFYLLGRLTAQL